MGEPPKIPTLVVKAENLGPLPPEGSALALKLINLLKEDVLTAPDVLHPQLVTAVLIKVLTGHVATCRVVTKSKLEVATNLAGYVFADYLEAHSHIVGIEAKTRPAG